MMRMYLKFPGKRLEFPSKILADLDIPIYEPRLPSLYSEAVHMFDQFRSQKETLAETCYRRLVIKLSSPRCVIRMKVAEIPLAIMSSWMGYDIVFLTSLLSGGV